MAEFKVGQMVVCVEGSQCTDRLVAGKVYTVMAVYPDSLAVGDGRLWSKTRFMAHEVVKPIPFCVGDTVQCIDPQGNDLTRGQVLTVKEVVGAILRFHEIGGRWCYDRFVPLPMCYDSGWLGPPEWPDEKPALEPFRFTGPGRYRSRDGRVFTVSKNYHSSVWPYAGCTDAGEWREFKDDGTHYIDNTELDLVARVSGKPATAKLPRQWRIHRFGNVTEMLSKESDGRFPGWPAPSESVRVVEAQVLHDILALARGLVTFPTAGRASDIVRICSDIVRICEELLKQ